MVRLIDGFASGWLVFWLSLFAVYIHFGALAFSGLVILLGAVGWVLWLLGEQRLLLRDRDFGLCLLAFTLFFLWLATSSLLSDAGPDTALRLGAQMLLTASLPIFIITRTEWRRSVLAQMLMALSLAGLAVMALDVASGYGINLFADPVDAGEDLNKRQGDAEMNIGRGHVVYAVLAPLFMGLFATRMSAAKAWVAISAYLALLLVGTHLNRLAIVPVILIATLPFVYLGWKTPKWGPRVTLGILASSILFAPVVGWLSRAVSEPMMDRLPMSWDHRLRMWDYSLARISENPVLGSGLDSSRLMQEGFTTRIGVDVPFVSLHPHNIGLQTWMEAGAIGAILLTIAIVSLYRPIERLIAGNVWRSAAVSGTLMAVATASAVTVGAWQYWWWGLIGLALALILLIPHSHLLSHDDIAN